MKYSLSTSFLCEHLALSESERSSISNQTVVKRPVILQCTVNNIFVLPIEPNPARLPPRTQGTHACGVCKTGNRAKGTLQAFPILYNHIFRARHFELLNAICAQTANCI